jgi:hypothetical protein
MGRRKERKMFVPVKITSTVGAKAKKGDNQEQDVKKVQGLLRQVFGSSAPVMKDGTCDDATKAGIADFQRIWGGFADNTVERMGETLKRLNRVANPVTLKPIRLGLIERGGYIISYQTADGGPLPPAGKGYTLLLGFQNEMNTINVTGRNPGDLLDMDNLGDVLKIIDKLSYWGQPIQCKLYLKYKDALISTSNGQSLACPVQPHNGKMLPLDESGNGDRLTYQGDPEKKDFHGRMFAKVSGFDKHVFKYAGKFETNGEFRGFDCITYAGTTCGASTNHMADSVDLAKSLLAKEVETVRLTKDPKTGKDVQTKVKLEKADPADVKAFFKTNKTGYFLMWSEGHIVIVADGTVHEFKASEPSGYATTAIDKWLEPYKTMKLTVSQLQQKPALAA